MMVEDAVNDKQGVAIFLESFCYSPAAEPFSRNRL